MEQSIEWCSTVIRFGMKPFKLFGCSKRTTPYCFFLIFIHSILFHLFHSIIISILTQFLPQAMPFPTLLLRPRILLRLLHSGTYSTAAQSKSIPVTGSHRLGRFDAQAVDVYKNAHAALFLINPHDRGTLDYVWNQCKAVPDDVAILIVLNFRSVSRIGVLPRHLSRLEISPSNQSLPICLCVLNYYVACAVIPIHVMQFNLSSRNNV